MGHFNLLTYYRLHIAKKNPPVKVHFGEANYLDFGKIHVLNLTKKIDFDLMTKNIVHLKKNPLQQFMLLGGFLKKESLNPFDKTWSQNDTSSPSFNSLCL